ncbi:MAG: hypothetical protein IJX78_01160 [Bacilli bacterium]|nr:hypothetical protein [Bacilli bacterium]
MIIKTIIILGIVIILFIGTYILNKRVPKPDGCEISEKCETCGMTNCFVKKKISEGEQNEGH